MCFISHVVEIMSYSSNFCDLVVDLLIARIMTVCRSLGRTPLKGIGEVTQSAEGSLARGAFRSIGSYDRKVIVYNVLRDRCLNPWEVASLPPTWTYFFDRCWSFMHKSSFVGNNGKEGRFLITGAAGWRPSSKAETRGQRLNYQSKTCGH